MKIKTFYHFLSFLLLSFACGFFYNNADFGKSIVHTAGALWIVFAGFLALFALLAKVFMTDFLRYCVVTCIQFIAFLQFPIIICWIGLGAPTFSILGHSFTILGLIGAAVHVLILYLGYKLVVAFFSKTDIGDSEVERDS